MIEPTLSDLIDEVEDVVNVEPVPGSRIREVSIPDEVEDEPLEESLVPHKLHQPAFEPYRGTELRRTCVRPGAYDAFDKPSLNNQKPSHVK